MSTAYEIRYYQDWNKHYLLIATCSSLDEARQLRRVSGDLIVEQDTNVVVADPQWLWDWEKTALDSYARQNLGRHRPGTIMGPHIELSGRYGVLPEAAP